MKGIISIFTMPQELEDLALTLERLKRNSAFIDNSVEYKVDITMCLSDELTDWENSRLPKEYIKDRSIELCEKYLDWCKWEIIHNTNEILGCVSQRRYTLKNNSDADFFIWLDTDMVFKDTTLYYMASAYKMVKNAGMDMFVITPQFVKQWDSTWDVLTNNAFLNSPINYHLTSDIYRDGLPQLTDVKIREITQFKFAGGWFTLITKALLDKIGIPESFGHYGLEDTFVMACSSLLAKNEKPVRQFVMENFIIGENHKNRPNQSIKKYLSTKDRKEEFKKVAWDNWDSEINKFIENAFSK